LGLTGSGPPHHFWLQRRGQLYHCPLGKELTNAKQGVLNKVWTVKYLGQFGDVSAGASFSLGRVSGAAGANAYVQALLHYSGQGIDLAATYDKLADSSASKHLQTYSAGGSYAF